MSSIDSEIERVQQLARSLINAYLAWNGTLKIGQVANGFYTDICVFVNFRVETAESCLSLLTENRVADSLGLSRAVFENYLLLKLLCRGDKYFLLQNLPSKTPAEIKAYLAEQKQDLIEKHERGERLSCLYVASYKREKKHLMYVFEGLNDVDEPGFRIPLHYFEFREFNPTTMRLKDEDYFEYYEPEPSTKKARKKFQLEELDRYRHYLSYDALLQCLEINNLADVESIRRIEAHYTFLGSFLHPTHDAARQLHDRSNHHSGRMAVGMDRAYKKSSVLLASVYVAYLLAGMFEELVYMFKHAPKKFIADPGTDEMRKLIESVTSTIEYFWFIDNEAPLWDRFNHAVHHATDEELAEYGGYAGMPTKKVKFESAIFSNFEHRLSGWSNTRVGAYKPTF